MKKTISLLMVLCLTMSLLIGCGSTQAEEPAATPEPAPAEETVTETPAEAPAEEPAERVITVTDMSGDEVTITGEVKTIVNLWPAGTSSFFVMGAGDMIAGLAVNNPGTMNTWTQFFYPGCVDIPAMGGTTPSVEEIINLAPDLVIIHPSTARDGFAQQIRDVGIPAININFSNYETMIKAYTMLGEILGGEYQEKLATWCDEVAAKQGRSQELTAGIADEDKPVVHYISGQGESLTTTMSKGSIIQSWVENSGGLYAPAVMELEGTEVTAEQIFELNPDIIIVGGTYQHVLLKQLQESDGWKDLDAVKNGRVYTNPYGCFNWDRFGLESNLQLDYALMCIQPEIAAENGIDRDYMVQEIVDFYGFYNGKEMTLEEAGFMLDGLMPTGEAEIPAA